MSSLGGLWIWENGVHFLFIENIRPQAMKGWVAFTCSSSGLAMFTPREQIRQIET